MSDTNETERPGHSTGPRSDSGKEKSSRNATTHGLACDKFFLLDDEKQEDFDALAQRLADEYKHVATPGLQPLLQTLVEALWLQNRAYRKIFQTEMAVAWADSQREFEEAERLFKRLLLMQRYKTSYENSYQRALRAIEAFRKSRIAGYVTQVRIEKAMYSMISSRIKSYARFMKAGNHTEEEGLKELEKLYASFVPHLPHWSPQNQTQ